MFSIELLFDNVSALMEADSSFSVTKPEMPTENNFIRNLWFTFRSSGKGIHHITGDIHYVALALAKRKTMLTIHDCVFLTRYSRKEFKYWFIRFFWYQLPVWLSESVTVISEKTKEEVITLTGVKPDKVQVIPNFYDPRFNYVPPRPFDSAYPRILQIGTKSNKNINRLVEALQFIPCELHVVGVLEEDTLALLKKYNIHYLTYDNLSFDALRDLYIQSDLVAFISTYEGFGLPILEAFAVGRPLITSSIAPMDDIAGPAAEKVNPYNVLDIRRGLLKIIQEEDYRASLIRQGLERVQQYSISDIVQQYADLYRRIDDRRSLDFFRIFRLLQR